MHLRISRVVRNGKAYQYAQLVESYRRPSDGMPAHRVVANLGNLDRVDVDNLRVALTAARAGQRVVVASVPRGGPSPKPTENLRYLDLAVLRSVWQSWKLDELIPSIAPASDELVPLSAMMCALTLQRCTDPGSKLYATRWIPRTALPELLGFAPSSFHNTRVHRALEAIESCTESLQAKLVDGYQQRDGAFATLFVDATDTWFVGQGPTLAQRAKTKEGHVQRKIGIVLLCNEHGYPLRWEVVAGRTSDVQSLGAMVRAVAGLRWSRGVPVVCDRAMGRTAQLREMLAAKLRFVTALTSTEFDAYVPQMPWQELSRLETPAAAADDEVAYEAAVEAAQRCALQTQLELVDEDLLVWDAGVVERLDDGAASRPPPPPPRDQAAVAMQHCRDIEADLASGRYASAATAGRARGLSKSLTVKYRILRALPDDVQRQILDGKAAGRALAELIAIAQCGDADAQRAAFDALVARPLPSRKPRVHAKTRAPAADTQPPVPVRVHAAVYFNPRRFVDERLRAGELLARIERFVEQLNSSLASPRSRMKPAQILAAVDRELRKDDLVETFCAKVHTEEIAGRPRHRVTLTRDDTPWQRRRRCDGFCVVVAHPELPHDGAALCRLYRQKDTVEKDFQTIKSLAELRPVRHRDDAKVRAHVTICMLALLLERTLDQMLDGLCSAAAALETLEPVRLNRYAADHGPSAYIITRTDESQDTILRRLRLPHLALDEHLLERITPR